MLKDLKKEIKAIPSGVKEVQEFGLGGLIFFSAISLIVLIFAHKISWKLLVLAGSLFVLCRFFPSLMKFVYIPAMIFALIMGSIVSQIILTILFITTITPIALIGKLCGKRFLDLEFRKAGDSYWIPKNKPLDPKKSCENQF